MTKSQDTSSLQAFTPEEMQSLLERFFHPDTKPELLRVPGRIEERADGVVGRLPYEDLDTTIILKFWVRPGIKGKLKWGLGKSSAQTEYKALEHLYNHGMRVPQPLGLCRVPACGRPYTESMFMSDLGKTVRGPDYLEDLLKKGETEKADLFLEQMIQITEELLDAKVIDTDHGINNTVVTMEEEPIRIDFEVARIVNDPYQEHQQLAKMIGRYIITYAFVIQPDMEAIIAYAEKLYDRLKIDKKVRGLIRQYTDAAYDLQRTSRGIDYTLELPV